MAIKTWFTQPKKSFSSFYYLDTTTRDMIRIRLELGREESNGYPMIIASKKRYVGFGTGSQYDTIFAESRYSTADWHVVPDTAKIYHQKGSGTRTDLTDEPTVDLEIADYSLGETDVHFGNKVTTSPTLPKCDTSEPKIAITTEILTAIAKKYAGQSGTLKICEKNATECELAAALKKLSE